MPPNGGVARPHDAPMEPFLSELKFNATLLVRVGVAALGFNGFPGSHANLNGGNPSPGEHRVERVLAIKVHSTSLSPKGINNEATQNVQWLPRVGEAAGVIRQESGGVVVPFHRRFAQKDERPGNIQIIRRVPFRPDPLEGFPGALRLGAFHEAVLGRFLDVAVANLAMRREAHGPEPSADRKAFVERKPDEGPHLARARAMPDSGRELCD